MSALARPPHRMTVAEFLLWEPGDGLNYDLVDGEPRAMAPASVVHGLLQGELGALLRNHLRARGPSCDVIMAPGVVPYIRPGYNVRIPDLSVTCVPVRPGQAVLPDPVLVIEIMSPSNEAETWSNVWTYASIPSVLEIVVLQSQRIAAEVLRRSPEGAWPKEFEATTDELRLDSIGFRIALRDVYERTGLAG